MNDEINKVLSQALGGGGAGFMLRLLPPNVGHSEFQLQSSLDVVVAEVRRQLSKMGKPIELKEAVGQEGFSAVLGSGRLALNPAVLTVWASQPNAGSGTNVRIRGIAKEGLIKQRGGEEVVNKFSAALKKALP